MIIERRNGSKVEFTNQTNKNVELNWMGAIYTNYDVDSQTLFSAEWHAGSMFPGSSFKSFEIFAILPL